MKKIVVSTFVEAPLRDVWLAYTTPEDIKLWNTASSEWHTTSAQVDLRPGGKFSSRMEAKDGSFGFDFAGEYTKVVEHQLIEYQFGDRLGLVEFGRIRAARSSPSPSMANRLIPKSNSALAGKPSSTTSQGTSKARSHPCSPFLRRLRAA
jgi:uncharacterized protein YndB with AHSA1/START domain